MLIHLDFNFFMGKLDSVITEYNKSITVVYKRYFRVIKKLDVNSNAHKVAASESVTHIISCSVCTFVLLGSAHGIVLYDVK